MLSEHPRTQATTIEKFIDCKIEFIELDKTLFQVPQPVLTIAEAAWMPLC
ncbi:hypothetical protein [Acinetobacter vivianii]|nr:hypothetical protein [Acinetobacter vivianii]